MGACQPHNGLQESFRPQASSIAKQKCQNTGLSCERLAWVPLFAGRRQSKPGRWLTTPPGSKTLANWFPGPPKVQILFALFFTWRSVHVLYFALGGDFKGRQPLAWQTHFFSRRKSRCRKTLPEKLSLPTLANSVANWQTHLSTVDR